MNFRKSTILVFLFLVAILPTQYVMAENRIGLGLGVLYNGVGFNYSKSKASNLIFASVGCLGFSITSGSDRSDNGVMGSSESFDSNCGIGAGYFSSTLFSNSKHAVGASLGISYNTGTNGSSGVELSLTPGYVYFLNGIQGRGLNLGLGGVFASRDGGFDDVSVLLNIGFHL